MLTPKSTANLKFWRIHLLWFCHSVCYCTFVVLCGFSCVYFYRAYTCFLMCNKRTMMGGAHFGLRYYVLNDLLLPFNIGAHRNLGFFSRAVGGISSKKSGNPGVVLNRLGADSAFSARLFVCLSARVTTSLNRRSPPRSWSLTY